MKKFLIFLLLIPSAIFSNGEDLLNMAKYFYLENDYYSAITESMRFQCLYPEDKLYPESMVIMGKSFFKTGRAELALNTFSQCYSNFYSTESGQEALFLSGVVRLLSGSFLYGDVTFRRYNFIYKDGIFYKESLFNSGIASALAENYDEAKRIFYEYKSLFPEGSQEVNAVIDKIQKEEKRQKKSPAIAGLLSALIPGSGYLYTENYRLAGLSIATNAALIGLAYDGYRKNNKFQLIFFSIIELSFYNYYIAGAIKSAKEYNEPRDLNEELLLMVKRRF